MLKLFQIDSCLGIGSTGRISEQIGTLAREAGWDTYIAHGARYVGESQMHSIQIGSKWSEYFHYAQGLLFDNHGLASVDATKHLIKQIEDIQPNVIQLHCIHGYYLNYKLLFEYLSQTKIPVVWTFHDCWAFTGHCTHFDSVRCTKWADQEGCRQCPLSRSYPKTFVDRTKRNFQLKRQLFTSLDNMTIVSVSHWLDGLVKQSFFSAYLGVVIYNGIDTDVFRPITGNYIKDKYGIEGKKLLLGVATAWGDRKGLTDYVKLSNILSDDYQILLVGLNKSQIEKLPASIIGISRTEDLNELVQFYSAADIVMNLSYEESFGLTTVEGFACGTPSIVYNATASPELVTEETGVIVEPGDINGVVNAVDEVCRKGKVFYSEACRKRALSHFAKSFQYQKYIDLYEELIKK